MRPMTSPDAVWPFPTRPGARAPRVIAALAAGLLTAAAIAIGGGGHRHGPVAARAGASQVAFEVNGGQAAPAARFVARAGASTLLVERHAIELRGPRAALRLGFAGAHGGEPYGLQRRPGIVNVAIGNDPRRWRQALPTYAGVRLPHVWRGIDGVLGSRAGQLEYGFRLAPGADPAQIAMRVGGRGRLGLDHAGDLLLSTGHGVLRQGHPRAFQLIGGRRVEVPARFAIRGRSLRIELGRYNRALPLTIDPTLGYSTYLGGSGNDVLTGVAGDPAGAVYVTGGTASTDYPTANAAQGTQGGGGTYDVVVTKLNPSGSGLAYSTYLGGADFDRARAIAVDAAGDAYVTGAAGAGYPTTVGAFQTTASAVNDAFVTKLGPTGAIVYSTLLGGNGFDEGGGIAVLGGNAYVAGITGSSNFPSATGTLGGSTDAFVAELNAAGTGVLFSRYLGGSSSDAGNAIAVDSGGVYVAGETTSSNFPTPNGFDTSYNGAGGSLGTGDGFAAKLTTNGSTVSWGTYLGGSDDDSARAIALDGSSNVYVAGFTNGGFPTTTAAAQTTFGGAPTVTFGDGFAARIASDGSALDYGTYIGGSGQDEALGIVVDAAGDAIVAGGTASSNFPTQSPIQDAQAGSGDAFVTQLNPSGGAFVFSTYLGGASGDGANAIALSAGNPAIVGTTNSTDFPTASQYQAASAGGGDGFVAGLGGFAAPPQGGTGAPSGGGAGATTSPATTPRSGHPGSGCTDRRRFAFTIPARPGDPVVWVRVYVNGRAVRTAKARAVRRVAIRRLPLGNFSVRLVSRSRDGREWSSVRHYRRCHKGRPTRSRRHHRHAR